MANNGKAKETYPILQHPENYHEEIPQVYKTRWLVMLLFALYCIANTMQFPQYSSISNIIVKYYNVSDFAVTLSSLIFAIVYVLFNFPGNYILERFGMRKTILLGSIGTCLSAWMKLAGVNRSWFWLVETAQVVAALAQVLVLPIPPRLAAIWFGDKEVSRACSIGLTATQIGIAIGFIVPPLVVINGSEQTVRDGLLVNTLSYAMFCTIVLALLVFFFDDAPPSEPSITQLKMSKTVKTTFQSHVMELVKNKSFMCYLVAHGVNVGIPFGYKIMFNTIILAYYPGAVTAVGVSGFLAIFSGIVGSLVGGIILDKFHKYQETSMIFYFLYFCSFVLLSLFFNAGVWIMYILITIWGFFIGVLLTVGFEVAVELTYPISQGTSGGVMTTAIQLASILFTTLYAIVLSYIGIELSNFMLCGAILIADVLLIFVKFELKRQISAQDFNYRFL